MTLTDDDLSRKLAIACRLAARLERLSVDSTWARRASGMRGSLLKAIERVENSQDTPLTEAELAHLDLLLDYGFQILESAARQIPG
jgi:hypothetical protein